MKTTPKRQPKGVATGGQFAANHRPESTIDLGDIGELHDDTSATAGPHDSDSWTSRDVVVDGYKYHVGRTEHSDQTVEYVAIDYEFGGGWRVVDDPLTRRAKAYGRRPNMPFLSDVEQAQWRDRGEVDIRHLISAVGSPAALVELDQTGSTYFVDGRQDGALSDAMLRGVEMGQMMLIGQFSDEKDPVAAVRQYVEDNRRSAEMTLQFRPDMEASVRQTLGTLTGMEFAAELGVDAARANTVGAQKARGR